MENHSTNYLLLALVVLAWGFSWYGIVVQVAEAPPLISLAWRFALAALFLCGGLVVTGRWQRIAWADQKWLAALGFCLFSMNFICFYFAALYLPSGLLSVVFASAAILGAVNAWLFFRKPLEARVLLAATLGIVGLSLLLLPEMDKTNAARPPWWAIALPFLGTYFFSLGNIISARLSQSYSLPNVVGQGMIRGTAIILAICLVTQEPLILPTTITFWGSTLFLALVSSVLAFLTYLTLVNRVGTARASYATVLFPIVAMLVSSVVEDYSWTFMSASGLALALSGTYLTFAPRKP